MPILTARDGHPLHFADEGEGSPIVLIHGWSAHGGFFGPQRVALQRGFRVVTPDLRGHRRSRRAGARPVLADLADDLRELLDYLGLKDAIVVGWSMGGHVLFDYLQRHGNRRLGGVVIEDMSPRILNDDDWTLGIREGFNAEHNAVTVAAMRADWPAYAAAVTPRFFAEGGVRDPKLADWVTEQALDNDLEILASLWRSMAEADYRDLLPDIDLPVMFAYGGQSQVYPAATAAWQRDAVPGSRTACFEDSGHSPHLEEADAFTRMLAEFAG